MRKAQDSEEFGMTIEEEKILKQALKNSIAEQSNMLQELAELEDVPVFRPTEEEFQNPIRYLEKIFTQHAGEYGVAKIVPPASFRPPVCFPANPKKPLPYRLQELQVLSQARVFSKYLTISSLLTRTRQAFPMKNLKN